MNKNFNSLELVGYFHLKFPSTLKRVGPEQYEILNFILFSCTYCWFLTSLEVLVTIGLQSGDG